MKPGDRVSTPNGPGTIIGRFDDHDLRGRIRSDRRVWIVELDEQDGQYRSVYEQAKLRLIYSEAAS